MSGIDGSTARKRSLGMVRVHTKSERIREINESSRGTGVSDSQ